MKSIVLFVILVGALADSYAAIKLMPDDTHNIATWVIKLATSQLYGRESVMNF